MASITSTGIGSGLDVTGIVTSLMAVNRRPLTLLQTQTSSLNSELSIVGTMKSFMSSMRDKASALTSLTLWDRTSATSADTTKVNVTTAGGAAAGRYLVKVDALATGQTVTSAAQADSDAELSAGSLTITLGSWNDPENPTVLTPKAGATPVTVDIPEGATSLADIRDAINDANAGVTATIINDATGARLSFTSTATGEENAFTISVTEDTDDGVAGTGLSSLTYQPASLDNQLTRYQTAANAEATVNGIPISSASNTLEEVADGLTLTLSGVTSAEVEVKVSADTESVRSAVNDFLKSYNDLMKYLRDQTKYDEATKKGGALQGDSAFVGMQYQLRGIAGNGSEASQAWSALSEIGITQTKEGMLEISDSSLFNDALENLPEMEKLFAADGDTAATTGYARQWRELADGLLGTEGTFESRTLSLRARIDRNEDQQDAMEFRLGQTEARLYQQYETLDSNMARLQALSSYVQQQLLGLNSGRS